MSVEVKRSVESVTWDSDGTIWAKEVATVIENGVEIAATFTRTSYAIGSTLPPDAPAQVKMAASIARTPEAIAAHQAKRPA